MTSPSHRDMILDQFSRQAVPFSTAPGIMDEQALRALVNEVKIGRLSRRAFVQTMVGLGLTAPLAAQMHASAGVAQAQTRPAAAPRASASSSPTRTPRRSCRRCRRSSASRR